MESIQPLLVSLAKKPKSTVLFICPDGAFRQIALERMQRQVLCKLAGELSCTCPSCNLSRDDPRRHPESLWIAPDRFVELMQTVYTYPPPVIVFPGLAVIGFQQQMNLLIWLERYSGRHTILMAADHSASVLPTIRSRSWVFNYVPPIQIDEDDKARAYAIIRNLLKGEYRVEDAQTSDEYAPLARMMMVVLQSEYVGRHSNPSRRVFSGSDSDLVVLMRILNRYLDEPKNHNFPLLLRGYQVAQLQRIR